MYEVGGRTCRLDGGENDQRKVFFLDALGHSVHTRLAACKVSAHPYPRAVATAVVQVVPDRLHQPVVTVVHGDHILRAALEAAARELRFVLLFAAIQWLLIYVVPFGKEKI